MGRRERGTFSSQLLDVRIRVCLRITKGQSFNQFINRSGPFACGVCYFRCWFHTKGFTIATVVMTKVKTKSDCD